MATRTCAKCNREKDMSGGKICEKGHFFCKDCVYSGVIIISERKYCPIDKTPLK